MTAKGIFGPVLTSVLVGAMSPKSKLAWSRWEQGPDGPLAVFKYVVPKETPLYEVTYCCLPEGDGKSIFKRMTGYHGEFAIDPESGAIRRLAVQADLESKLPMIRSELMVEYSPVEIGGKVYICPAKSVSISRERTTRRLHEWGANFGIYGPFETMLNDTVFGAYHLFRSESRMVIPDEPARAKP